MDGGINLYAYVGNNPVNFIDPFGLEEGSLSNLAKRKAISRTALGYKNSHIFDYNQYLNSQYPKNSWKCSAFVCTVLADAGVPISVVPPKGKKRCATAGELSNKRWNPKDWRQLKIGESPQAGDVAAYPLTPAPGDRDIYSGHSGIVTGEGVIASHENGVYVQPGQFDSTIEGIVYRRYIGE